MNHHQIHHYHHHHQIHHFPGPYPAQHQPVTMDPPDLPSPPGTRRVELQGPRPTPLRVSKESHKITKKPLHHAAAAASKPPLHPKQQHQPSISEDPAAAARQPVIIYSVSPKVIHADPSNFMSIVQRLTGLDSSSSSSSADAAAASSAAIFSTSFSPKNEALVGPVSPAARFAAIEKTTNSSPRVNNDRGIIDDQIMNLVDGVDVFADVGNNNNNNMMMMMMPGILSPAPGNLPGLVSAGMFSPSVDMQAMFGVPDMLSPLMFGHSFLSSSPSGLLSSSGFSPSALVVSPTLDFSNLFDYDRV